MMAAGDAGGGRVLEILMPVLIDVDGLVKAMRINCLRLCIDSDKGADTGQGGINSGETRVTRRHGDSFEIRDFQYTGYG